jgi:hypothetical protein
MMLLFKLVKAINNAKEFHAHSVILYFKSALTVNWFTKENNMIKFNKPDITPNAFEMILKYG